MQANVCVTVHSSWQFHNIITQLDDGWVLLPYGEVKQELEDRKFITTSSDRKSTQLQLKSQAVTYVTLFSTIKIAVIVSVTHNSRNFFYENFNSCEIPWHSFFFTMSNSVGTLKDENIHKLVKFVEFKFSEFAISEIAKF